jgi:hypothetical protein
MAYIGHFINGNIRVTSDGQVRLAAEVLLVDDVLGPLASRNLAPSDPAVEAQVRAFIEASLPALSAFAGYEITLPEAQTPPTPVSTPPTTVTSPVTR